MSKMQNRWAESSPKRISIISVNKKSVISKTASVIIALLCWQLAAMWVDSPILLVSPLQVVERLSELIFESDFLSAVGFTFSRIAIGFLGGLVFGVLLALFSGRFRLAEILLWPYMLTVKSVPVASFVVLALIWFTSANLAVLISFLMVLPVIYTNVLDGIKSVDRKMLEMADVFKMPFSRRVRFIWLPAVKPFLLSGVRLSLGLAWKSGVAAELIGYPEGSVGEALYYSKLFLDTDDLFAWTVVIVLLSVVFEKLFLALLKRIFKGAQSR